MLEFTDTILHQIAVHQVGNKSREEDITISKSVLKPDDYIRELLLKYFLSPFKTNELYHLHHETEIELNEIYHFASAIFSDPDSFYLQSINLAKHLYENSVHPKIKGGEFYVTYLKDCIVGDVVTDGIGLFKSESKETYLKVFPSSTGFEIDSEKGININKLEKGCLIFNSEKEKGYLVAVVDNISKGNDAQYWKDSFLKVKPREDNYFHTQNIMRMYKEYVTEKMPEEFELNRADQADMLNRSISFFKEKEEFSIDDFNQQVLAQPELISNFNDFRHEFESENDLRIIEEFKISENAVKKQARVYKSVIKLDKNFHIYVHGNRDYIVKGFDEASGMHYYQIFFKEEN